MRGCGVNGAWIARPRAEAAVGRWLRQPGDGEAPVLVVTGPAGSGKSALVRRMSGAANTVLIDAGGRSTDDVARAFAAAAWVGGPLEHPALDTAGLIEQVCAHLAQRPVSATAALALTNVDRAGLITSAGEPDRLLTGLVAALARTGRVRVLLEVCGERWTRSGLTGEVVDLGPGPYAEPGGPAALAESVLVAAQGPYAADPETARAIAAELAAQGGEADWLGAEVAAGILAAERLAVDTHAPDWPRLVPHGMQAALDRFVSWFGEQAQAGRAVLTALGFARGRMLEGALVERIAAAIAPSISPDQVGSVLAAGEGVVFERADADGRAAYALRWPGVADRIRERYGAGVVQIEQRIAEVLWAEPAAGSAYAHEFLPVHAAAAGWLEQLLADPALIGSVSLRTLATVVEATPIQSGAAGSARRALISRAAARYNPDAPEPLRRSALHFEAALAGDRELAQALAGGEALPWQFVWKGDARQVDAIRLAVDGSGRAFAVSWGPDGQREVRDLYQGTAVTRDQVAAQDRTLPDGLLASADAPNCYWMTLDNRILVRLDDGARLNVPLPGKIADAGISGDGILVAAMAGGELFAVRISALAVAPGTGAVTLQQATSRGREWLRKGGPDRVVDVLEFELGYVIAAGAQRPASAAGSGPRRPATLGGSSAVIDKRTGRLTYWPSVPSSAVADLYARSASA